jgi:tRNA (pseudouridine54-N1)-methyltransferase
MEEQRFGVLDEQGCDIRKADDLPEAFLLSDHLNFSSDEETLLSACPKFSVGPAVLHAESAIAVLLNELDRRASEWN